MIPALFKLHPPDGELKIRPPYGGTNSPWRTFAASDLPSLFTSCRDHSRRISRLGQCARFGETDSRQRCTKVSPVPRGRGFPPNHLSSLDVLAARHHPDGRILFISPSPAHCAAHRLRTRAAFCWRIPGSARAWNSLFARCGTAARRSLSALRAKPVAPNGLCLFADSCRLVLGGHSLRAARSNYLEYT